MSAQIDVDFDPGDNRLLVRCPFHANDLIRDLPSYRWSKTKRAWLVPLIRKNVEALQAPKLKPYISLTNAANEAILRLNSAVLVSRSNGKFPAWYPFKTEPLPHQRRALDKGYSLRSFAIFMDTQTGKSKTAIDLCAAHRMEGGLTAIMILVKLSLRKNWLHQFNLHCPLPFDFYMPFSDDERGFRRWLDQPHDLKVMAVGWESLSAGRMFDFTKRFMMQPKVGVIGDETTYIAGHKAIRSKRAVELGGQAEYRYALTGTPILEGPLNLFMQFEYLDPNVIGIGDFYAFRNRYAVMGGYRDPKTGRPMQIVGYQNLEELSETVAPFTFQAFKSEVTKLPPKRYEERTVVLSKAQRALYDKIKKDGAFMPKGAKEEVVLKNVLGVALRLHQVAGGYAVKPRIVRKFTREGEAIEKTVWDPVEVVAPLENPKVIEIMETIEEMGKSRQGLIWCVYLPEIGAMRLALMHMGLTFGELHGGISEPDRQPNVDRFERGDYQFILGNASTGGMGYTMMASQVNMFYSNTFKMIDRAQAEDRAYGIGQTKAGIWIDYTAEKTIDQTILAALADKKDVATYVRERIAYAAKLLDGEAGP
jgi:hypothetical protein